MQGFNNNKNQNQKINKSLTLNEEQNEDEEYITEAIFKLIPGIHKTKQVTTTYRVEKIDPNKDICKYIGKDVVVEQSLAEGSTVKSGDEITFKVLNPVEFPDFSGKSTEEVTNWSNNNCVQISVTYQETVDKNQVDKVISQSKPKGSTVKAEASLSIVVGKKSAVVETRTCVSTTDSTKTKNVEVGTPCPDGYKEKGAATDNKTEEKKEGTTN